MPRTTPNGDYKYGATHRALRTQWKTRIDRGDQPTCTRCPYPILSTDQWDLDHNDNGIGYQGPAHTDCNRRAGAVKKNKLYRPRTTRADRTTRNW